MYALSCMASRLLMTAAPQFSQWSCRHLPADHHTLLNKATAWFRELCGRPGNKGRFDSQSGPGRDHSSPGNNPGHCLHARDCGSLCVGNSRSPKGSRIDLLLDIAFRACHEVAFLEADVRIW